MIIAKEFMGSWHNVLDQDKSKAKGKSGSDKQVRSTKYFARDTVVVAEEEEEEEKEE